MLRHTELKFFTRRYYIVVKQIHRHRRLLKGIPTNFFSLIKRCIVILGTRNCLTSMSKNLHLSKSALRSFGQAQSPKM